MDLEKLRDWTATVAIPLSVVISTIIYQRGQDKLTAQAHRDQLALKFIELGWEAIIEHDESRTKQVLKVLTVFDAEAAEQLAIAAAHDSLSYPSVLYTPHEANYDTLARLALLRAPVAVKSGTTGEGTMTDSIADFVTQLKGHRVDAEWIRTGGHPDYKVSSIHFAPEYRAVAFYLQQHIEARFRIYFDMHEEADLDGIIVHTNPWAH